MKNTETNENSKSLKGNPFTGSEVEEYFWHRYETASFRVVPGHWPDFKSKEEVDHWMAENEKIGELLSKIQLNKNKEKTY